MTSQIIRVSSEKYTQKKILTLEAISIVAIGIVSQSIIIVN
jgi:hypothetical protein